jgi:hypothetical protein
MLWLLHLFADAAGVGQGHIRDVPRLTYNMYDAVIFGRRIATKSWVKKKFGYPPLSSGNPGFLYRFLL